jgi:hypothetical protein
MPRLIITRDATGAEAVRVRQGEISHAVSVNLTYPVGMNFAGHEQAIWETGVGHRALHDSHRVQHPPVGMIGYIHSYNNVLFAVGRLDIHRHTIQVIGVGHVHAGVHRF